MTRRPTGAVPWPMVLVAGTPKSGMTHCAAEASASPLVGRTLWISIGHRLPDQYAQVEGADFEIVEHSGSYRSILGAVQWASAQPRVDDKPTLLVVDDGGKAWKLLTDQAQLAANERARRAGLEVGVDGVDIPKDLWHIARQRWGHLIDALREHDGPVLITSRLDQVEVYQDDKPTGVKLWKEAVEKSLTSDVDAIVHLLQFGDAWLVGVASQRLRPKPREYTRLEQFRVHDLWVSLGLEEGGAPRGHSRIRPSGEAADRDALVTQVRELAARTKAGVVAIAEEWAAAHSGEPIAATKDLGGLELLRDDLLARLEHEQEAS